MTVLISKRQKYSSTVQKPPKEAVEDLLCCTGSCALGARLRCLLELRHQWWWPKQNLARKRHIIYRGLQGHTNRGFHAVTTALARRSRSRTQVRKPPFPQLIFHCDDIFSFSQGHESTPKESAHSSDKRLAIAAPPPCHAEGTPRGLFEYVLHQPCVGRRPTTTPHFPSPRSVITEQPEPVQYEPLCVSGALSDRFRLEVHDAQERPIYCLVLNATWLISSLTLLPPKHTSCGCRSNIFS